VPDIAGVVEVQASLEHDPDYVSKVVGEVNAGAGLRAAGGCRAVAGHRACACAWAGTSRTRRTGRRRRIIGSRRAGRRCWAVQERGGLADAFPRLHPGKHNALRSLGARQVGGEQIGQTVAGVLEESRIVGRGDTLPRLAESIESAGVGQSACGSWVVLRGTSLSDSRYPGASPLQKRPAVPKGTGGPPRPHRNGPAPTGDAYRRHMVNLRSPAP
jgi:hypothetical protein